MVADEGLRGLTHRAVDRRAGFPEGTCSAYLRTRQALQVAVTQYVTAALTADVDRLAAELSELPEDCAWPEVRAQVVERTLALFERWLSERELVADPPRAVHGGAPQPGGGRGRSSSAGPAWSASSTQSSSPASASTAPTAPRRSWPPSTGS